MRIEVWSQTEAVAVLQVEGWVDNPALVRVLREEVDGWLDQGRRVVLELAGLKALSPEGLVLVHSWQGRPVELRRMPVFIGSLIELLYGPQGLPKAPIHGLEDQFQPLSKA